MTSSEEASTQSKFSLARVLPILVPILLIAWGVKAYSDRLEAKAKVDLENSTIWKLLGEGVESSKLSSEFADTDGDLVADTPTDASKLVTPTTLRFSYIAQSDNSKEGTWKEFLAAVSKNTGLPVEEVAYSNLKDQLADFRDGKLHLTAFSTGETETAVNSAGFVPMACFANDQGEFGTKMLLIAPANGAVKKIDDIRGKRLTLVRLKSNSGCLAPLVLLSKDHNMHLDKDFSFGMSQSHENSIRGVAKGEYDVAAVSSDILSRLESAEPDVVKPEKINIIYESKIYPPGVLGVPHNLDPKITEKIKETFTNFDWKGTGLESTYHGDGSAKFALVSYKNDWSQIRDVQAAAIAIAEKAKKPQ